MADYGAGELQVRGSGRLVASDGLARVGASEGLCGQRRSPGESECGQDRCEE